MFVTVIALKYELLVSQWSYGHFLKLTDSMLFELHDKSSPFDSTHYIVLYSKNGDTVMTTASVTSVHPTYISGPARLEASCFWQPVQKIWDRMSLKHTRTSVRWSPLNINYSAGPERKRRPLRMLMSPPPMNRSWSRDGNLPRAGITRDLETISRLALLRRKPTSYNISATARRIFRVFLLLHAALPPVGTATDCTLFVRLSVLRLPLNRA